MEKMLEKRDQIAKHPLEPIKKRRKRGEGIQNTTILDQSESLEEDDDDDDDEEEELELELELEV